MDKELFEALYRRYYQSLFLYAYSLTHSRADAEDLTANTFVKTFTTFTTGNVRAWMYKVLRNEFLDWRKKRGREVELDPAAWDRLPAQDDVWRSYLKNEELHWLYAQISLLPRLERETMLLTIQTDYQDSKIADILGITAPHVRVLRHRAKARLIAASKEDQP